MRFEELGVHDWNTQLQWCLAVFGQTRHQKAGIAKKEGTPFLRPVLTVMQQ
jgi:hypothetical protein